MDDFINLLEYSKVDANIDYPDFERDQMRALDLLASYYVQQANKEKNKDKKNELFAKADQLFNAADKIIMYDQVSVRTFVYFIRFNNSGLTILCDLSGTLNGESVFLNARRR